MLICRYFHPQYGQELGFIEAGHVYRLSPIDSRLSSLANWLSLEDPSQTAAEAAASRLKRGTAERVGSLEELEAGTPPGTPCLLAPVDDQEVWAAGVTYRRSKEAREEESAGGGSFYDKVYSAERPELFFKGTAHRTARPGQPIRIRKDSSWNVPEPEMALVVSASLKLAGYTIGNDVSSRDIEGANPLYLPQAKVYMGSCALGPAILLAGEEAPAEFEIHLRIVRDSRPVYEGSASTAQMKRSFADLIAYLGRENSFPGGVILLTGTGIVPPDDFTLRAGDVVSIAVPGIGALTNPVGP
ncbi:MAG: fumarylacetoacetate hydrolase family protein [Armatimonadetes bacterium]|nr:fumarylacetoacetate hydrolase family protein [Armatimonadota bacterium]